MTKFVREGRIYAWGVSNWKVIRIEEAVELCAQHPDGYIAPICSSVQESVIEPAKQIWPGTVHMTATERAGYHRLRMPNFAWETVAKGFLCGKWDLTDLER